MKLFESVGNSLKSETTKSKFNLKDNQVKKINTLLLLAAAGIVMMFLAGVFASESVPSNPSGQVKSEVIPNQDIALSPIAKEEAALSQYLQEVLGQMKGVGQVTVKVSLAATTEQELAINTSATNKTTEEKDQGGGTRVISETTEEGQLVLVKAASGGQEEPVVIKQYKPDVQGVLVVAEGADNPEVKIQLTRAVETLLSIPVHRVNVVTKESGE